MKMSLKSMLTGIALLGFGGVANAVPMELVTNGGFETGDLTGWTCTGADSCSTTGSAHSGSYAAIGFDNSGYATLSQDIATVIGATYDLSFWSYAPELSGNILRYMIDSLTPVTVPTTASYSLTSTSFVASGTTTSISLLFETDSGTGTWRIDDVSVTGASSAVPEPTALALMGLGLAGIGFARKKKQV